MFYTILTLKNPSEYIEDEITEQTVIQAKFPVKLLSDNAYIVQNKLCLNFKFRILQVSSWNGQKIEGININNE